MVVTFEVMALENFPLIKKGDDIAEIFIKQSIDEGIEVMDKDIIILSHKIISKSEGRVVHLSDVIPSSRAIEMSKKTDKDPRLIELILSETIQIIKNDEHFLLVKERNGIICLNAGIDKSNIEGEDAYCLLPIDPNKSAKLIMNKIKQITNKNVGVIICDTYSRPFRKGQTNQAIGISGISPFRDYKNKLDLFNYKIKIKNAAITDELSGAAELIMGQGNEGRPIVTIRGLQNIICDDKSVSQDMFVPENEDIFKNCLCNSHKTV